MNKPGVEPLAFSANDLAVLFSVSVRQIWSMHQVSSLGPSPLRLGARLSRWDRKEVEQWWYASKMTGRPISRREWLGRRAALGDNWPDSEYGVIDRATVR